MGMVSKVHKDMGNLDLRWEEVVQKVTRLTVPCVSTSLISIFCPVLITCSVRLDRACL